MLSEKQQRVADKVVVEESRARNHVVVYLSGAHAYGFPSPDSDLDLKCVHAVPTRDLLGLGQPKASRDRLEFVDEIEIDYTSNELQGVLQGILSGNGNYIERIIGNEACFLASSDAHRALQQIVPKVLSRNVFGHYRGFAANQRHTFEEAEVKSAKKLLYVLRTALTGVHLLRTGELIVDLNETMRLYGYEEAAELIEAKKQGERTVLSEEEADKWTAKLDALFAEIEAAHEHSMLPQVADSTALNDWLVDYRLTHC